MGALIEAGLFLLVALGVIALVVWTVRGRPAPGRAAEPVPPPVSDRHRHRWNRWRVVDERRIHLYGEVDEGRDLPDRIDVVLRRECARCGLPQTQTVRGLDAQHRGPTP